MTCAISELNSTLMMSRNCETVLEIPIASNCKDKVHNSLCIDRISLVILDIESARPNCKLAMEALCSLHLTLAKAKSVIKDCSKCSKLYLAITSRRILSRCQKLRNSFELYLKEIQGAVTIPLADKISAILHDLRSAKFCMEFAEEEARKVLLSLFEKNFPDNDSMEKEELEAIQIATSRLEITSSFSVSVEKATIKNQLEVNETNPKEKELLEYLMYLLIKYRKFICQFENGDHSPTHDFHDQSFEHELVVEEALCENQSQ